MRARHAAFASAWLIVFLGVVASVLPAGAQNIPRARENFEYRLIDPRPVETGDRIEVVDFFWYGCPHCYNLQAMLEGWIRRKPADVAIRRVPAILRESWAPHARIYYTLEALGEAERLHQQVYHGYHVEKLAMSNPDVTADWAARHGINRQKWLDTYTSAAVTENVRRALAITISYNVQGTPSLVVDGRFITSSGMVEAMGDVIFVLEDLVLLARQQRAAR